MRLLFPFLVVLLFTLTSPVHAIGVMPPPAVETETAVETAKAEHQAMLDAMTPKERRTYRKEQRRNAKSMLKEYRQAKKAGQDADADEVLLILLCVLLPPLAVYLYEGEIATKFWISVILSLLGWIPGIIYALLVVTGNAKK